MSKEWEDWNEYIKEWKELHCFDDHEEEEEMSDREAYLAQFDQNDFI